MINRENAVEFCKWTRSALFTCLRFLWGNKLFIVRLLWNSVMIERCVQIPHSKDQRPENNGFLITKNGELYFRQTLLLRVQQVNIPTSSQTWFETNTLPIVPKWRNELRITISTPHWAPLSGHLVPTPPQNTPAYLPPLCHNPAVQHT